MDAATLADVATREANRIQADLPQNVAVVVIVATDTENGPRTGMGGTCSPDAIVPLLLHVAWRMEVRPESLRITRRLPGENN